jgi:hypothetical protein
VSRLTKRRNEKRYKAVFVLVVIIAMQSCGLKQMPSDKNDDPLISVNAFLTDWLIKRDVTVAVQRVSDSPILGTCSHPPDFSSKATLSPEDYRSAVKAILVEGLKYAKPAADLSKVIKPVDAAPPGQRTIKSGQPFDLFSLNDPRNARFICKFDSSRSFREKFEGAGIWYATWAMRIDGEPELEWILAWKKEKEQWRLLSIALLDD